MPKKAKPETASIFVPEAEQPYKIPDNWRWVRLSALASPSKETTADFSADIRYVGLEHMETGRGIVSYGNAESVKSVKNVFHDGQILYGKLRPYLNKHDIADFSGVCSTDILVFEQTACSCAKYVNYYFDLPYFFEYAVSHSRGIHLPRVTESILLNAACPLPPLAEQQRIVDRIESLFTKLDAAREKAQAVVDGFELRKAAILHRAFTGELTEQWRANNGASSGRKTVTIASVCHSLKYGTAKKSAKAGNVVVLRMGNLQGGEIDWSNLAYSNDEEDNEKYFLSPGDVLFNRTNSPELVGKTSIYRGEFPAIYAGYLIKLDYNRDIISGEYLNYMLNSPEAKEYCKTVKTDGVNQSNINAKRIGAFLVPLPSLNEQKETEKRLQSILRKQLQVSEAAQQVIDNIDAMKRAILGRAFRGELGTNDPSEASPDFAVTVR